MFEALASGCFPVVTDLPGTRAFIESGKNGLLVPVGSPEELAAALIRAVNEAAQFESAILGNRTFIERGVDLKKNMKLIWERYLAVFNS